MAMYENIKKPPKPVIRPAAAVQHYAVIPFIAALLHSVKPVLLYMKREPRSIFFSF